MTDLPDSPGTLNVRRIARTSAVAACPTAVHTTVNGIDIEQLLAGTPYHEPARVPSSARQRGARFERLLADHDHLLLRKVVSTYLDYEDLGATSVQDLRNGFPDGLPGLQARAAKTRWALLQMAATDPAAPNLLVGPVLTYQLGPYQRYAEADFIARPPDANFNVLEAKAHPIVDGVVVGGPQSGWRMQIGLYALALRTLLATAGYARSLVSDTALLIVPEGLTLRQPICRPLHIAHDRQLAALTVARLSGQR